MNLLIVDDYPTNLKMLRVALEAEGHSVEEAVDGTEALARLGSSTFDAIISDVLMPTMDGFRLCHEVRKLEKLRTLPLILYTSTYNSPTDRALADSVGADAYILKPAPVSELLNAIEAARARPHARTTADYPAIAHTEVLERYNAVLVRKLESRNIELAQALASLNSAHVNILELNRSLESRVEQRTAALDAANRELEAFSFSVSHDLRAPVRQITGLADLLKEEIAEHPALAPAQELPDRILVAARQMNDLIDAMLEFARTARAPLALAEVDLEAVLAEALETIAMELHDRDIEWRRSKLPRVHGDAVLLRQVLINLLSNAVKYSRGRAPAIIEIGQRDGRADEVVVFVRDNGVGFDVRRAGELFGVFKRLHSAEKFEGTGIGLATAQRIISRLGGSIWAEARIDHGAMFSFSLKRA